MLSVVFTKISAWMIAMIAVASHVSLAIRWRRRHSAHPPAARCPGALRVLFLHRDLPHHGGVSRCLLYLARGTDPQKIEFHVASFDEPSAQMEDAFAALNIEPRCIGDRGYRLPAQRLGWLIEERGIDIVVATTFKAYLCAKWATRGHGVGVVFWIHAIRGTLRGRFRRGLIRFLSKDDPMLFVSWAARRAHLPPGHRAPAQVVHNGVEDVADDPHHRPYGPEMRQSLGLPPRGLVLAYIGEFVDWKDHPTAINAMHELVRKNVDAQLLLIGVGREMESARRLAASGPAEPRIHFLGARSDVPRILGLVDIYIHPCREEGFGLAVVEAMLAKCAVVAAREGALVELIESGKTGLLVTPGDSREFAGAVLQLAADPDASRGMALAARESCLEKFDIDKFADRISGFLEDCFPSAVRRRREETHSPQRPAAVQTAGAHG
ncbi:MAG TPA: glycosyltransferase family 4 protein [Tepidisphaeraceae bacterium]|jgi:glycosyltransferase involved in cell wall biosynthesis|nr:glycosyltransferase family 4 protein [Tepidisphaeraceae bacterium]